MGDFKVHILGCGSAIPTAQHYPSSQVVELRGKLFMIDCGEGTQRQFRLQKLNFQRLVAIFISHLHGDHCFGLIGLISTLGLLGRTGDLQIIGTKGLKNFLEPFLEQFCSDLKYKVVIKEVEHTGEEFIYEDRSIEVKSFPLYHRMPTIGFVLKEKIAKRHIDKASVDFYKVPRSFYPKLLLGEDFVSEEGEKIPNERLTKKGKEPKCYAYMSDTSFNTKSLPYLKGVTTLYHEATFMEQEKERAKQTAHSTAKQAGEMACLAGVERLLIGHYSARYYTTKDLLNEAKEVFENTIASKEGMVIEL